MKKHVEGLLNAPLWSSQARTRRCISLRSVAACRHSAQMRCPLMTSHPVFPLPCKWTGLGRSGSPRSVDLRCVRAFLQAHAAWSAVFAGCRGHPSKLSCNSSLCSVWADRAERGGKSELAWINACLRVFIETFLKLLSKCVKPQFHSNPWKVLNSFDPCW